MNTSKLAKQIKKELTRNTKKTVALGLVSLVALWFWVPLAWKWIAGDSKKKKSRAVAAAAAEAAAANQPIAADSGPAAKAAPVVEWDKLLERIAKDELMTTASLPQNARDPFGVTPAERQAVAVSSPITTGAQPAPIVLQAEATPEEAGLLLEATFVSPRVRRATISGKTYRQQDRVRVGASNNESAEPAAVDSGLEPIEFIVKLIEPRRVVLTRGDQEYPLLLKREALGDSDQLTFGTQVTTQP